MSVVVDRALRDCVRFTGDGLPNAPVGRPLPIGDPTSGVYNPSKKDLRDALNEAVGGSVLQRAYDFSPMNSTSAALAVAGSPSSAVIWMDGIAFLRDDSALAAAGAPFNGLRLLEDRQDDRGALAQIGLRAQNGESIYIACYGDSTVLGADSAEVYNNWPNRLGSILRGMTGNDNIATYNCGSGGKKIIDGWAHDNYAATVTAAYPNTQYVAFCFGDNDIKATLPGWDTALYKRMACEFVWQVRASGRIPIMVTSWMISAEPIRPNPLMQAELYNAQREIAELCKVDLIDTNQMLSDWQTNRRDDFRLGEMQPDGTHYLDRVHVIIAQHIARLMFSGRVVSVKHGSRIGPQAAKFSPTVAVAYDYWVNNFFGLAPKLTAVANENYAAEWWVWSDCEREVYYVSPDRDTGGGTNIVYVEWIGSTESTGVALDFGAAAVAATERPSENHIRMGKLQYGLNRLRYRAVSAGTFRLGYCMVTDGPRPVFASGYSVATAPVLLLDPDWATSADIAPRLAGSANYLINGDIPVGWGVVISTQYLFQDAANSGPSRRAESIVVLRTATGADIVRVRHFGAAVIFGAVTSIKTSGSGAWTGQISVHMTLNGANQQLQVRAAGQLIAAYDTGGTLPFIPIYGHLGGLYRDNAMVTDPAGRQAQAIIIPQAA